MTSSDFTVGTASGTNKSWWLPIAIGTAVMVVTGVFSLALKRHERVQLHHGIQGQASLVWSGFRTQLEYEVTALERMATRWEAGGKPSRHVWERDARRYVDDFGHFQAIEWVDPSYHVRWIVPIEGNEQAQDLNLAVEPRRRAALEAAQASYDVTVTEPVDLVQGGRGLLLYCPIHSDQSFDGFILGVFRINDLLADIAEQVRTGRYNAQLVIGQDVVYRHVDSESDQVGGNWAHQISDQLYGKSWTLELAPSRYLLAKLQSPLPTIILVTGTVFCVLTMITTRLIQIQHVYAQRVAKTQKQLHRVIEASPSGMIMVTRQGVISMINTKVEQLFGYTRHQLIGQPIELLVPNAVRIEHARYRDQYFADPYTRMMGAGRDLRGVHQDGREFAVEIALNPVETAEGIAVLATVVDITSRKEAQEALQDSEARSRAVVENALDAIVTISDHGIIQFANASAERVFGYTQQELLGKNVKLLMPAPYKQAHDGYLANYLITGEKKIIGIWREVVGQRKDGSTIPMLLSVSQFRQKGKLYFTGMMRDITKEKEAQENLRHRNTQLQLVHELSQAANQSDDVEAMFQMTVDKICAYAGWPVGHAYVRQRLTAGDLMPTSIWHLANRDRFTELKRVATRGAVKHHVGLAGRVLATRSSHWIVDVTEDDPFPTVEDKSDLAVRSGFAFAVLAKDEVVAVLEFFTDQVTEPDDSKLNFLSHLSTILGRVVERKSATEALVLRAQDLERSNRELDDFAYIASHDLKEPLRGIHNYAMFLQEDYADRLDDDGASKLNTLSRLTQRMESLIDDLLHFSRVGRVDLAYRQTDLNAVLQDVIASLEVSLQTHQTEVRIPRPLPVLNCDQVRIAEVFRNLITNAMKYNDKPEKWIEIGFGPIDVRRDDGDNGQTHDAQDTTPWLFYVRDNGIGIQNKHQEGIFRIFKRLHGRDKFGGGTGAGLTIVKKIVERHGGKVWVESEVQKGTTFYFTLRKA